MFVGDFDGIFGAAGKPPLQIPQYGDWSLGLGHDDRYDVENHR